MDDKAEVIITAGFDKSVFSICLAELLQRKGVRVKDIIVVNPFSLVRLRKTLKKKGVGFVKDSIPRLLGTNQEEDLAESPLAAFKISKQINFKSLKRWCAFNKVPCHLVTSINSSESEEIIIQTSPDYVVYGGGGIIRKNIIRAAQGRILNAHLGPLPEIRGMNAIEWSLLLNEPTEITIHFIDSGIDTGKIIERYPVELSGADSVKVVRERAMIAGIKGLTDVLSKKPIKESDLTENKGSHRQCFVLSDTLKAMLQEKLNQPRFG